MRFGILTVDGIFPKSLRDRRPHWIVPAILPPRYESSSLERNDVSELKYLRARDVMTTRVIVCAPGDTMQHAQEIMRENRFRHLPVAEDGRVKGILSLRDTLATRLAETEEEKNVLREVLIAARGR